MTHPKTLGDIIQGYEKFKQQHPETVGTTTPKSDALHSKWEGIYLDNGGALTLEQRDKAFSEAMKLAREFEQDLGIIRAQIKNIAGTNNDLLRRL